MEENIADTLQRTAEVLHWLGKYRAANTIDLLSRLARAKGITTLGELDAFVQAEEAKVHGEARFCSISRRRLSVVVNCVWRSVPATPLSYEDVVRLAGRPPSEAPTVTWAWKDGGRDMHPGCEPVVPRDGMVFSVVHTGAA